MYQVFRETPPTVSLGFEGWLSLDEVRVLSVTPGSAADKAKFRPGDQIVGVENDIRFKTWDDFYKFIRSKKPGDKVRLEVTRNGKRRILAATLEARESAD